MRLTQFAQHPDLLIQEFIKKENISLNLTLGSQFTEECFILVNFKNFKQKTNILYVDIFSPV